MCFNLTPKEKAYDNIDAILENSIFQKLLLQLAISTSPNNSVRDSRIGDFLSKHSIKTCEENIMITLSLLGVPDKKTE